MADQTQQLKGTLMILLDSFFMPIFYMLVGAWLYKLKVRP
jgi:hypothetical protein